MTILIVLAAFLPFVIIFGIVIKRSVRTQERLKQLEERQQELRAINSLLAIEKEELLQKQAVLDKELMLAIENNANQQEKLNQYAARQQEFHVIKFTRLSAWGSPAYSISVDALGNILFHGQTAVRKIGFFQWKIYRKRINNLNHIIQKSGFFNLKETHFQGPMEHISAVNIEIYLKNGLHKKVFYDHAASYPMNLSFLERKLDLVLGTQKLWLYWKQEVVQFSVKRGLNYRVTFILHQGLLYTILGQEYFSDLYQDGWSAINELILKYDIPFSEETHYSYQKHPKDTIWVELATGFRFLISPQRQAAFYQEFASIVEQYGHELQA